MLKIFICEDDYAQREKLFRMIEKAILIEDISAKIVLSCGDPTIILDYLNNNPETIGLYFLDVDLNHKINGIALASKIKIIDSSSKIVFITTHNEMAHLTFKYKVEAMDYILKDNKEYNIPSRVKECIFLAIERFSDDSNLNGKFLTYSQGDAVRRVNIDDILFVETSYSPHKLLAVLTYGEIEFYGSIKALEKTHKAFARISKSCVANINNIERVEKDNLLVYFIDGQELEVAKRRIAALVKKLDVYRSTRVTLINGVLEVLD
ncbi:MAG: LytR/AlgR family response regulator transcription factor [Bacilli bacterium]